MPRDDERWDDARTAWTFTALLVLAFGGVAAVVAGLLALAFLRGSTFGATLLVPLPLAVAGTTLLVALGVGLALLRPWETERDGDE